MALFCIALVFVLNNVRDCVSCRVVLEVLKNVLLSLKIA